MFWIILAIIVAFLKSLWELAGKVFTDEKKKDSLDEYSLSLGTRIFSCIILLPIVFFVWFCDNFLNIWWIFVVSSVLWAIATVTALKAVKYWDLSLVSPLTALTLPLLLISSYFITHEQANIYWYLGVLIIFIGTYFLQIHESKQGLFWPFLAIYHNLWARYMLITAVVWSITAPLDKIGVLEMWAINWIFFHNVWISLLLGVYMFIRKKHFSLSEMTQLHSIKKIWAISVIWWLTVFLQMIALKYTLVIYVIALKRASGIFSVFLWWIFYKETHILQKLTAAAIMLCWVIIISLFGNI